jgi:acyltransferase
MNNQRIKWVDIIKGIGIMLVVVGHSNWIFAQATTTMFIQKYIYSFHMPLFFFLSGYLFVKEKYPSFKKFLITKVRTLLMPYLFFAVLSILFDIVLRLKDNIELISFKESLIQILYLKDKVGWNEPLWYLACLFIVEIMFYFICRIKAKTTKVFTLLICMVVGYSLCLINDLVLPWGIGVALTALIFYAIGSYTKNNKFAGRLILQNKTVFFICLTISVIIGGVLNTIVIMYYTMYGNFVYFYIASITGIVSYVQLSQFISNHNMMANIFGYFGRNSLVILCTHYFVFKVLQSINILNSTFENYIPIKGYVYALITLVISIPAIFIMDKYFPFILGKRTNKNNRNNQIVNTQ